MQAKVAMKGSLDDVELPDELLNRLNVDDTVTVNVTAVVVSKAGRRMQRTGELRTDLELKPIAVTYTKGDGTVHVDPEPDVGRPKVPAERVDTEPEGPEEVRDLIVEGEDGSYQIPPTSDENLARFLGN